MTYDTREVSNYDGAPIALYEFIIGGIYWRYTSARRDITVAGATWESMAISDEGITASGDSADDEFKITMPSSPFTDMFIGTPPSSAIYVNVRRVHHDDNDAPIVWAGTLKSVKRNNAISFEIICRTITSSLNRLGLRLNFSRNCPHSLYDLNCMVNKAAYALNATVMSVTGNSFIHNGPVPGIANYYSGGFIEFTVNGLVERRPIESQVGSTITLLTTTDDMVTGMTVTMYPGCDRTTSTCNSKFNNLSNYGGFPNLPTKSPFDFDPVF